MHYCTLVWDDLLYAHLMHFCELPLSQCLYGLSGSDDATGQSDVLYLFEMMAIHKIEEIRTLKTPKQYRGFDARVTSGSLYVALTHHCEGRHAVCITTAGRSTRAGATSVCWRTLHRSSWRFRTRDVPQTRSCNS